MKTQKILVSTIHLTEFHLFVSNNLHRIFKIGTFVSRMFYCHSLMLKERHVSVFPNMALFTDKSLFRINTLTKRRIGALFRPNTHPKCAIMCVSFHTCLSFSIREYVWTKQSCLLFPHWHSTHTGGLVLKWSMDSFCRHEKIIVSKCISSFIIA